MQNMSEKIIILDFGSQVTQLIGRRLHEEDKGFDILPGTYSLAECQDIQSY